MPDLERALAIIAAHPSAARFIGRRAEIVVLGAEGRLGLRMPPTYRRFLLELGAGSFGSAEIYGAIDLDIERSSAPDAVWSTLFARERSGLPADLVIIGIVGDEVTCLRILPKAEEGPVIAVNTSLGAEAGTRTVSHDFGAHLLSRVERELAPES
jgi:antitoxin YobK